VILTESPIRMFSPNFLVRTSILELPPHLYGAAFAPSSPGVSAGTANDLTRE
jgi:hypothetical protein